MDYLAKADISTLPEPDITTLPLQGGHPVPTHKLAQCQHSPGYSVPTYVSR
jgi:hypothetical protein